MERTSESGLPVDPVYDASKLTDFRPEEKLGRPGEYPFTRGVYPRMYVDRPWTMRQYAGFSSAEETNTRFRLLLDRGQTGLSVAFDLPTQLGLDSDHPLARGEVGRTGVAIDSIEDMRMLLAGLPLEKVTTSMTINSTAAILLLLYELVAEEQGQHAEDLVTVVEDERAALGRLVPQIRPPSRQRFAEFVFAPGDSGLVHRERDRVRGTPVVPGVGEVRVVVENQWGVLQRRRVDGA
jgi:methylmalonyl-CoA mutase N-terminal domain/subunit